MRSTPATRAALGIKGNFFFYFFAMGTTLPYFSPFFREFFGFSDRQIGYLFMVQPACALLVQPLWAGFADRTGNRPLITALLSLGSAGIFLFLFTVSSFWGVFLVFLFLALVYTPCMSLGDSVALVWLGRKNRYAYSRLRIAGTIGFLIAAPAMGYLFDQYGIHLMIPFFSAAMAAAFFSLLLVPNTPAAATGRFHGAARLLQENPRLIWFLASLLLTITAAETAFIFLGLYTRELGGTHRAIGWIWAVSTLAELAIMPFIGRIISRLGVRRTIVLGMAGAILRWAGTGMAGTWWHLFPLQVLHICTFCFVYIGGITYMDMAVPASRSATAQGLFGAFVINGGRLAAGALGGYLAETAGYRNLFFWCSAVAAAGWVLFFLTLPAPDDELFPQENDTSG